MHRSLVPWMVSGVSVEVCAASVFKTGSHSLVLEEEGSRLVRNIASNRLKFAALHYRRPQI
jgi:hypothetical protein